jgi:hypothetical protein
MIVYEDGSAPQRPEIHFDKLSDKDLLLSDCAKCATDLGRRLQKKGMKIGSDVVIIGTGGDFEFTVALSRQINPEGKAGVGCLWPVLGHDRTALHFEQEYFEAEFRDAASVVVAMTIANDMTLIEPLLRRVAELIPKARIMLLTAYVSREVHQQLVTRQTAVYAGRELARFDIDYWHIVEALDQREVKWVPRMTHWLVDRMDARATLRANLTQEMNGVEGSRAEPDPQAAFDEIDAEASEVDTDDDDDYDGGGSTLGPGK